MYNGAALSYLISDAATITAPGGTNTASPSRRRRYLWGAFANLFEMDARRRFAQGKFGYGYMESPRLARGRFSGCDRFRLNVMRVGGRGDGGGPSGGGASEGGSDGGGGGLGGGATLTYTQLLFAAALMCAASSFRRAWCQA